MQHWIQKASHLIEALPYIRRFYGKIFVIKCGGAAMIESSQIHNIMQDIALLHFCGVKPVVVHGGGPEISSFSERLAIPTQFSHGQRVTDDATMEVVQMVLAGKTNPALVAALNQHGVKAVGITGQDGAFLKTKKLVLEDGADLGFVGDVTSVDTSIITSLLRENFLPVIAPIGVDAQGQAYNINGDIAAGRIAGALGAEKFIMLSDINGVYQDVNDPQTRINVVGAHTVQQWLNEKTITGGMIPKLQAALQALSEGVSATHILDGKMPHSLLLEIFTDQGVGTLITK